MLTARIRTNFATKMLGEKSRLYSLVYAPEPHVKIYYFLLVNPAKEKVFLEAMESMTPFNIKEYGEIVASGYGEPSESLKQYLRDKYNADID